MISRTLLAALLCVCVGVAGAASVVSAVHGSVTIQRGENTLPAKPGMKVQEGDALIAERAHCEVYETNDITNQMRH